MLSGWDVLEDRLREALRGPVIETVAIAYEHIVNRSPVRTGAYRTEHVIGEGDAPAIGALLYESPDRVGPDTVVKPDGTVLPPPSVTDAKASLRGIDPFAPVSIINDRFYADRIENGSSQQAPQGVYQVAADAVADLVLRDDVVIE